jgi:hypothetical protein
MKTFLPFGLTAMLALAGTACAQTQPPAKSDRPCGMRTSDWCEAGKDDPCNVHRDARSCEADARCTGMPYRGESVVACHYDARGFNGNCPVVGCRTPAVSDGTDARK